ncbi:hypothetical protein T440DRAFT_537457 [Plenodomus tracheiphilus IPT5]|uniref:Survival Motor Neuron Gemin2-binding domain-containing protein n=1 Tax=Plenodomus tracheiphilus IPT5 TaxID=1408161 RepID=A0A6A7B0S0_9PLEO|nr:hypothetical protein T440DRAFT_537457 [Plenodomus tracheiphilus IPT5]
MSQGVDMGDGNAWDDSLLISSWDEAVVEYKKYHSIHKTGKKLEHVLTDEELKELRGDYGDLIEETDTPLGSAVTNGDADEEDAEMELESGDEDRSVSNAQPQKVRYRARSWPQQNQSPGTAAAIPESGDLGAAVSQALLGSVQDENLKNIMMSWYYAGYYTGLHAGQQQLSKEAAPNQ